MTEKLSRTYMNIMVGATGFEPVTFAPPVQCATGLRHAPMIQR